MDNRSAAGQRELNHFACASTATRRKAVPNRDQHIAVRDRGTAGHDIGIKAVCGVAWKLEQSRMRVIRRQRPFASGVIGKSSRDRRRDRTAKWHEVPILRAPARLRLRSGPRHRQSVTRTGGAAVRRAKHWRFGHREQRTAGLLDLRGAILIDAPAQKWKRALFGKHFGAVASNSDGENERDRAAAPPAGGVEKCRNPSAGIRVSMRWAAVFAGRFIILIYQSTTSTIHRNCNRSRTTNSRG